MDTPSPRYKWAALSATSLGSLLSVMSGSILMIALPTIVAELKAPMALVIWVLMSYLLALTILVPAIGRLADILGRKWLYVGGFAVFTVTSLFSGLADSGTELLVARIAQSIGGSLMVANATAIVADAFPRGELGKALGINSMIIAVGAAIAPIVGGFITVGLGWRWNFFINVPLGILGTLWAAFQIKDVVKPSGRQSFDWAGAILSGVGLFLLLMALSFGGLAGWLSAPVLIGFVASIAILGLFVWVETRVEQPVVDLRLLKSPALGFAYLATLLNGVARGALSFLLIFYLQGLRGMDPLLAGLYLTPSALAMMLSAPLSGALSDRHGSAMLAALGLALSAVGLLGLAFIGPDTPLALIILWQSVMGFGSGFFVSPNSNRIVGAVPANRRGVATGLRVMMNNAGAVVSIALTFAVISSGISQEAMQALFAGTQVGARGIVVGTFVSDLRLAFAICFGISLLAAALSFFRGPDPVWTDTPLAAASAEQKE